MFAGSGLIERAAIFRCDERNPVSGKVTAKQLQCTAADGLADRQLDAVGGEFTIACGETAFRLTGILRE